MQILHFFPAACSSVWLLLEWSWFLHLGTEAGTLGKGVLRGLQQPVLARGCSCKAALTEAIGFLVCLFQNKTFLFKTLIVAAILMCCLCVNVSNHRVTWHSVASFCVASWVCFYQTQLKLSSGSLALEQEGELRAAHFTVKSVYIRCAPPRAADVGQLWQLTLHLFTLYLWFLFPFCRKTSHLMTERWNYNFPVWCLRSKQDSTWVLLLCLLSVPTSLWVILSHCITKVKPELITTWNIYSLSSFPQWLMGGLSSC